MPGAGWSATGAVYARTPEAAAARWAIYYAAAYAGLGLGYDADGDRGARRYHGFLVSDLETLARPGPADPHAMLDAAGFLIPVADLANSGLYLSEGDWGNAFLSGVGAVPLVGDVAKGLVKGVDAIGGAVRGVDDVAGTGARTFGDPPRSTSIAWSRRRTRSTGPRRPGGSTTTCSRCTWAVGRAATEPGFRPPIIN
jgi:hypothetical protein